MKKGFTLIETIVVVAVISITLPVLFAIIFSLIRQQVKIFQLSQIKRDGDYLVNIMEDTIKDRAVTIHSGSPPSDANIVCKDAGSSYDGSVTGLYFLDKDDQWFGFKYDSNKIVSDSASIDSLALTSNKTIIDSVTLPCLQSKDFTSPSVSVGFSICYINNSTGTCASTRPEEISSMYYQTKIKLRSY